MFKQIIKVTQESVDLYLQDIITEGLEFASNEEATDYVLKLSNKIEKETAEAYAQKDKLSMDEQDEMIADMVLHFLVPEVEKKLIRDKITAKQKQNLKQIHDTIYTRFENLHKTREPKPQSEFELEEVGETEPTTTTEFSLEIGEKVKGKEVRVKGKYVDDEEEISNIELDPYMRYIEDRPEEIPKEDFELYLAGLDEYTEDIEGRELQSDENGDEYTYNFLNEALETITEVSEKSSQK